MYKPSYIKPEWVDDKELLEKMYNSCTETVDGFPTEEIIQLIDDLDNPFYWFKINMVKWD